MHIKLFIIALSLVALAIALPFFIWAAIDIARDLYRTQPNAHPAL